MHDNFDMLAALLMVTLGGYIDKPRKKP